MVTVLKAFETTAKKVELDPKEEWWDSLTYNEQKAYKENHPRSSKKFTTHEEKYNHHSHEANHHEEVYKYNIEKHERAKSPEQKRKIEDKIDAAEENMLIHRARADHHKSKIDDDTPVDLIPEYGDEGEGLEDEEVETPEDEHDESDKIHDGAANSKAIAEGRKGIHDTIKDSVEENPSSKKVNNALNTFKRVFTSKKQTPTIVHKVRDLIGDDREANEALKQADKYAEKKLKPPKHILKKLGKIAAVGLAVGLSVAVAGAMPTIVLAAAIQANSHSGGLGDMAWSAYKKGREARKNTPSKEDLETSHVKTMIEGLQEELKKSDSDERSEMLDSLIKNLKDTLYKHFPAEEPTYRRLRNRRKLSKVEDDEDD